MDVVASKAVQQCVAILLAQDAASATKYVSDSCVIKATRKLYKYNKRQIQKGEDVEIVLKIGRPNAKEEAFIKDCKKAGEPFPVKKIQLRFPPKKK